MRSFVQAIIGDREPLVNLINGLKASRIAEAPLMAKVLERDIEANNGVIHVIDKVLMP